MPVVVALAAMAVVAPSAVADASACDAVVGNVVQNCGFETGDPSGWSVASGFTGVDGAAHSGNYGLFTGNVGGDGTVSQTVSTVANTTYTFSYWLANDSGTPNDFHVTLDGVSGGSVSFDSMTDAGGFGWTQFTHSVTAAGASVTITFAARQDPEYYHVDDVVLAPSCAHTYTGTVSGLVATSGLTCIYNATVSGGISVARGASLDLENSTVAGSISANAPAGIRICGSTTGSIAVSGATGFVRIGDPANNCAVNTIKGGLTAAGNHGGGTISGNTITGSWLITNNTPPFTATGNHH